MPYMLSHPKDMIRSLIPFPQALLVFGIKLIFVIRKTDYYRITHNFQEVPKIQVKFSVSQA